MLHGGNLDTVLAQGGGQLGIADISGQSLDFAWLLDIHSAENDAGIRHSGTQSQINFLACMQAYPCGPDDIFKSPLFYHAATSPMVLRT